MRIYHFLIIVCMFISVVFINYSCKQNKPRKKAIQPEIVKELGDDYIFNGNTLEGWEISSFGTEGPVLVSEGNIVLNFGDGLTGVTYLGEIPKVNYEVSLEAKKTMGNDFFCGITFPVHTNFCSFIVGGWGGPVVGLSTIDGKDASENETRTLKNFEKDVWYNIKMRVSENKIEAWIDNEKLLDFTIGEHKLSIRPEVELSKPFGIASWNTSAAIRNIKLVEISE